MPVAGDPLKDKLSGLKRELAFEQAPRPEHWRAWRVNPHRIEFWDTGWQRLISRTRYQKDDKGVWTKEMSNP
jgi:pyridoxamine 5'-phosphate oxidase